MQYKLSHSFLVAEAKMAFYSTYSTLYRVYMVIILYSM